MQELKEQVEKLAEEELERANEKFSPVFHTTHEGYAILKEEIEEADIENKIINRELNEMWWNVKNNSTSTIMFQARKMRVHAINLAAEAVQVVAMCEKFIDSFENTNE